MRGTLPCFVFRVTGQFWDDIKICEIIKIPMHLRSKQLPYALQHMKGFPRLLVEMLPQVGMENREHALGARHDVWRGGLSEPVGPMLSRMC